MKRIAVVGNDSQHELDEIAKRFSDCELTSVESRFSEKLTKSWHAVWLRSGTSFDFGQIQELQQVCISASRSGVHLFIELPAEFDVEVLLSIASIPAAGGGQIRFGQPLRHDPRVEVIKDQLDAKRIGKPGLLRMHHWQSVHSPDEQQAASCELRREIDLACWLFGELPSVVLAKSIDGNPIDSSSYTQLHLGFPSGAMAMADHWLQLAGDGDYFSLSLIAGKGAVYADDHHNAQMVFAPRGTSAINAEYALTAQTAMLKYFLRSLEEQSQASHITILEIQQLEVIMSAAIRSSQSGQAENLSINQITEGTNG